MSLTRVQYGMNHVEDILKRSIEIHLKKREDYATNPEANPFENFDRSNQIAIWFPDSYKSFAVLIATKLARLASLLVSGRAPNNESIEDTFLDLVTYCALFYAFWKSKQIEVGEHNTLDSFICQHNLLNPSGMCTFCSHKVIDQYSYYFDYLSQTYRKSKAI